MGKKSRLKRVRREASPSITNQPPREGEVELTDEVVETVKRALTSLGGSRVLALATVDKEDKPPETPVHNRISEASIRAALRAYQRRMNNVR